MSKFLCSTHSEVSTERPEMAETRIGLGAAECAAGYLLVNVCAERDSSSLSALRGVPASSRLRSESRSYSSTTSMLLLNERSVFCICSSTPLKLTGLLRWPGRRRCRRLRRHEPGSCDGHRVSKPHSSLASHVRLRTRPGIRAAADVETRCTWTTTRVSAARAANPGSTYCGARFTPPSI